MCRFHFQNVSNTKSTRRIQVGWKHKQKKSRVYHQITQNRGGGLVYYDMEKNDTLLHLEQKAIASFFPDGFNKEQNLDIKNLDWFIASFTGVQVELFSPDGDPIPISTFLKSVSTSPVRIYLHTQLKVIVRNHILIYI